LGGVGREGAGDGLAGGLGFGGRDPVAAGAVARSSQRPGELGAAPELEGGAGRDLVGGLAFLAGELVDPLIGDDLEPVGGVEQEGGVGQGEVVGPLLQRADQDQGGGRGAGMVKVVAGMEAGDLPDGLG
jgi:hypothetical protein